MHTLTFIVAGDPAQFTGGYVYDARIVGALRQQGWTVDVIGLEGNFPEPDARASRALEDTLAAQADGTRVVIDGLAMGGLPEVVARHRQRLDLTGLIHHPLADETGLNEAQCTRFTISETRALAAVARVIATSPFTARRLADFDVPAERISVVEPGVETTPLAEGSDDSCPGHHHLLCVATIIPRKGHDVLIEALAQLRDHDWKLDCIGGLDRAPAHVQALTSRIREHGLESRVRLLGERPPEALGAAYHDTDLFVLASHYEGYGMVISEALARGLPIVTTTGGALAHTLPPKAGLSVPAGDAAALAAALRRWFDEPALRQQLREGAQHARTALNDWQVVGKAFSDALLRLPSGDSPSQGVTS